VLDAGNDGLLAVVENELLLRVGGVYALVKDV